MAFGHSRFQDMAIANQHQCLLLRLTAKAVQQLRCRWIVLGYNLLSDARHMVLQLF
jgi:hypothetical protein